MVQSIGAAILDSTTNITCSVIASVASICCALAWCMVRILAKLYGSWYCTGDPVLAVNGLQNASTIAVL